MVSLHSCETRWPVVNETMRYTGVQHGLSSVKHVLLHIGQHRLDLHLDGRLLCHCRSHISSPFWPPEDGVQYVPFANKEEDDDTGHDYLCPKTQTPVRPIITRPSNLYHQDISRQVVVLPPLLTRKVGARLALFCDVWRQRKCSKLVCSVVEVGFRLRFRDGHASPSMKRCPAIACVFPEYN